MLELRPEMATLTCGSVNFGDEIFENSFPIMRDMLKKMNEFGVRPELEIFDKGHLANARRLAEERLLSFPQHVDFVLGRSGRLGSDGCESMRPRRRSAGGLYLVGCRNRQKTAPDVAGGDRDGRPRPRRIRGQSALQPGPSGA